MAKDAKTVAETVDMPEGLDVIPTVPGTFVGGHDVQGADGKPRDDRPGEILGTPAGESTDRDRSARELETERADFTAREVDRNNREVLPLLGGDTPEPWEAEEGGVPEFVQNARTIGPKARKGSVTTADVPGTVARAPQAPLAHPAKSADK